MLNDPSNTSVPQDLLEVQAMLHADARAIGRLPDAGFEARVADAAPLRAKRIIASSETVQTELRLVGSRADVAAQVSGARWFPLAAAAMVMLGIFAYFASFRSTGSGSTLNTDPSVRVAVGSDGERNVSNQELARAEAEENLSGDSGTDEYVLALAGLGTEAYSGLSTSDALGDLPVSETSDWTGLDLFNDTQDATEMDGQV